MKSMRFFVLLSLYVSVVFVAIVVVVQRHETRSLFMEAQTLEKQKDQLIAEWSRLKLEQSTLLNQVNVEREAKLSLKMIRPELKKIVTIQE